MFWQPESIEIIWKPLFLSNSLLVDLFREWFHYFIFHTSYFILSHLWLAALNVSLGYHSHSPVFHSLSLFFFKDLFVCLFVCDTERSRDIDRGRSRLLAGSLMWDLIPGLGSHPEPKADIQLLSHPGVCPQCYTLECKLMLISLTTISWNKFIAKNEACWSIE